MAMGKRVVAMVAAFLLMLTALRSEAATAPSSVRITGFSYAGSGCPPGSLAGTATGDIMIPAGFRASTSGGFSNRRKYCVLTIALSYPSGWQYSVGTIQLGGSANLARGVRGVAQASYYVSGLTGTAKSIRTLRGPYNRSFSLPQRFSGNAFSRCNQVRNLNIKLEVRVTSGRATNTRSHVSIGGSTLRYSLAWRRC